MRCRSGVLSCHTREVADYLFATKRSVGESTPRGGTAVIAILAGAAVVALAAWSADMLTAIQNPGLDKKLVCITLLICWQYS